jgi:hypothetical protein
MVLEESREGNPRLYSREENSRLEDSRREDCRDRSQTESQVEARVKSLGGRVAQALLAGDTASLDNLLGAAFVLRMADGERIVKEELLHMVANRQVRYESLLLELTGVHVYDGQVAFLSGHCNTDKFFRGQRMTGRFPFTALWVCRLGKWEIVAIHHLESDERARAVTP